MKTLILLSLLWAFSAQADCRPNAPQNLVAWQPVPPPGFVGIDAIRVVVAWGDVKTERSYRVERASWTATGWAPYITLATLPRDTTSFTDWQPTGQALYRVSAVNACGVASSEFTFVPPTSWGLQ